MLMRIQRSFPSRLIPLICILWLVIVFQSPFLSSATTLDETFSLSVTIQSRHISHFEACIPVRVEEQFRVVWGNDKIKDSFSGVLHAPKDGRYPITLNISEGGGSCREMTVPSLTLDKADEWSNIVSMAFQHIDNRKIVLSKAPCQ
jgi:hypothetical protein